MRSTTSSLSGRKLKSVASGDSTSTESVTALHSRRPGGWRLLERFAMCGLSSGLMCSNSTCEIAFQCLLDGFVCSTCEAAACTVLHCPLGLARCFPIYVCGILATTAARVFIFLSSACSPCNCGTGSFSKKLGAHRPAKLSNCHICVVPTRCSHSLLHRFFFSSRTFFSLQPSLVAASFADSQSYGTLLPPLSGKPFSVLPS